MTATFKIPSSLTLDTLFSLLRELDHFAFRDQIDVEFNRETFFSPFSMLLLAAKLKSLRQKSSGIRIRCVGYADHPYPAHVGFFRFLGFDHGKHIGEAPGSENYIPITELSRDDLFLVPGDKYEELPDLVQRHADKLALMIARDRNQNRDLFDILSYSIREVIRNVFEHSNSDSAYYCAQYWPRSGKVEFSVVDFGIGIRRGLSENPNFRFRTDKEAIEYSLLPSVSGKTHLPRMSEVWFNSGYGLYMTNRLARNGGNFVLASGSAGIYFTRKTKTNYVTSFPGTALRFNMDMAKIGDVAKRLDEFRQEGRELAKKIEGSANRPPSAMSLLLRRDYSPGT